MWMPMPCGIPKHLLPNSAHGKAITLDETVKTELSVDMSEVQNEDLSETLTAESAA